jgi:hypothetical protein
VVLSADREVGPIAGSKDTLAFDIWNEALAVRSRR